MKAGWRTVPLGEVCELSGGGTPSKNNVAFYGGSIPWATVRDLNVEMLTRTEHTITEAGLRASSSRVIPAGEIVIASRVGLGKVVILGQDTAINQDLRAVIPRNPERLDRKFLFLWFKSVADRIIEAGTGATVQGVKLPFLNSLPVPLPPLEEQKRIVAVLDEAFEGLSRARANAEANLADAREVYESALRATFSYSSGAVLTKLEQFIDISHGFAFDGSDFEQSNDQSKPIVLTPGNYSEDGALIFSEKNTKRLIVAPPKQYLFERGDLTVVMTDLSSKMKILGKPAFVSEDNLLHNQRIGRVLPKRRDCPLGYIYHFLNSDVARRRIIETATGTMVRHTAPKRILDLHVPIPQNSADVQEVTVRLNHCQMNAVQLRKRYAARITELDALRHSLLQKAFSGKLT